jgi:hypothetical protein
MAADSLETFGGIEVETTKFCANSLETAGGTEVENLEVKNL